MSKIESDIITYIEGFLTRHCSENYEYSVLESHAIEVYATSRRDAKDRTLVFRVGVNHDHEQVYISNIFIPKDLQHNGIGKFLILMVFELGKIYSYDVFVVQLTDSFRERLLKRGAVETDTYDTLYITQDTILR